MKFSFDPGIVLPLSLVAILYLRGAGAIRGVTPRQRICFWIGWFLLLIALLSPLHFLGELLFSAHMVQHEILMAAAAPLLVLASPAVPLLRGFPIRWRRRIGRWFKRHSIQNVWKFLTRPIVAWALQAAALWLWHIPRLFQKTIANDSIHALQHLSFLGSALLFWWSLFHVRRRVQHGAGVLSLFTTAIHTSILGALLTFAGTVWYPAYISTAPLWGLTPLEDQQLGGLIMWIPGGMVYLIAALALIPDWLRESERSAIAHARAGESEYAR